MPHRLPDPDPHPPRGPGTPSPIEVAPLHVEPEIVRAGDAVHVTLAHPEIAPDALGHFLGSNILLVWSTDDPDAQRLLVHLPCDVLTETAVLRFTNGVLDLTVQAAPDPDPVSRPSTHSSSDGSP